MTTLDSRQMTAIRQAAQWFTTLQGEAVTDADQSAWRQWLEACAENRWAWEQVQGVQQRLHGMPAGLTGRALSLAGQPQKIGRRSVLKGLALAAGTGLLGYGGYREAQTSGWMADYRTATGEQRQVTLPDGSHLQLNTASAVDMAYSASERRLVVREGEVLITTAADNAGRPFFVQTPYGTVQALGTRFSVRRAGEQDHVAVFEHQVRITPLAGQPLVLATGTQCAFNRHQADAVAPLNPGQDAWAKGVLVANDQRLDAFLAELARYRRGWLHCDPAVAGLRISGAFAVSDTDQALHALSTSLPVRIEQHTRYWVTVTAR
ncbi:FecR domain-containing protein [Pseudomonas ovata]|uniref:FecR domain-containing protein n=1 Tax=Pseudomonas ovata TaxID=1839709 RepID=UPI000D69C97D|nr:FecR domain-containing protein [Pseudomonas ovata]